jgi:hypothetical protein
MHSRSAYLLHVAFAVLLLSAAAPAHAGPVMINNGLAPPNPLNVIDDATYIGDNVYVRNVGCPTGWPAVIPDGSCASPGAATEVEVVSGGATSYLYAYDSSTVTMSGGTVEGIYRYENLYASDSSVITISGIDFMVDGTPVPFGDLSALTGTLTGTLTSGDFIDNVFYQGGYAGTYTGIIRLVPEPSTAALLALGLVGIAAMRRQRAN